MSNPSPEDLNKLMTFFGRIPETHIKAMESYPFIFFNHVTEAKLDYDIQQVKGVPSTVSYDLILSQENDLLDKRFQGLEKAIKDLFWKEVGLKLSINGKEYKHE